MDFIPLILIKMLTTSTHAQFIIRHFITISGKKINYNNIFEK